MVCNLRNSDIRVPTLLLAEYAGEVLVDVFNPVIASESKQSPCSTINALWIASSPKRVLQGAALLAMTKVLSHVKVRGSLRLPTCASIGAS